MESRSPAPARDTRRVLLDTALDLFAEHGFAGTSMRTLARAAGLRESAIYHHFPSKEALFLGVFESVLAQRAAYIGAEMATIFDRPLGDILTRLCEAMVARMQTPIERKFWRIMLADGARLHQLEAARTLFAGPRTMALRLFEELRQRGKVRKDVPGEVFLLHFGAPLFFMANAAMLAGGRPILETPVPRFIKEHVAFMLRAVAPEPEAPPPPETKTKAKKTSTTARPSRSAHSARSARATRSRKEG